MTWKADIVRKEPGNGFIDFVVEFSEVGSKTVVEEVRVRGTRALDDLRRTVIARIKELDALKQTDIDIVLGPVDLTPVPPPPPPPPPTPAQAAERRWFSRFNQLTAVEELSRQGGLPPGSQADLVALRKQVKDDFLPAYFQKLRHG